jgi:hypothetical protein
MKIRLLFIWTVALGFVASAMIGVTATATGAIFDASNGDKGAASSNVSNDGAVVVKARGISGKLRDGFIDGGMKSCLEKAKEDLKGNEDSLNKMGITTASLHTYCECALNYAADNIEPSDMADLVKGSVTAGLMEKMNTGMDECLKSILPKK